MDRRFVSQMFPRSSAYHPEWIMASVSGGANSLWLTEWLAEALDLRPGMRVLDLGCGRGASSIFLRREFGVQVRAADLWNSVSERFERVKDAGVEDAVFPIHADARSLPFPTEFFDAIICIDAFPYCGGTDDLYLNYLARFVKRGGALGIAGAGVIQDIEGAVPEHLRTWFTEDQGWCLHSAAWWRRHWEQTGIVDIEVADTMPDGWQRWLEWHRAVAPNNQEEIQALETDRGRYLGYVRAVGRRRTHARLLDPIVSVPAEYKQTPLLRNQMKLPHDQQLRNRRTALEVLWLMSMTCLRSIAPLSSTLSRPRGDQRRLGLRRARRGNGRRARRASVWRRRSRGSIRNVVDGSPVADTS